MELIDSHCHLHFDNYADDADEVIKSAINSGVNKLICVGCSLEDSAKAIEFAASYNNVWAAAGAHPHDGVDFLKHADGAAKLAELLKKPKVVAVGEIGLDYFHENSPKADQIKAFKAQLEVGLASRLPFIFHVREAWEDFWPIIDAYPGITGVVHSFSTNEHQLDEVLRRGLYVGLNGIMTFTKDEAQLAAAGKVPLDKLLLETDAPFLTPKPFRGQRCEPKHVLNIAEFLAGLRGEPLEKLAAATTANAKKLFRLES